MACTKQAINIAISHLKKVGIEGISDLAEYDGSLDDVDEEEYEDLEGNVDSLIEECNQAAIKFLEDKLHMFEAVMKAANSN